VGKVDELDVETIDNKVMNRVVCHTVQHEIIELGSFEVIENFLVGASTWTEVTVYCLGLLLAEYCKVWMPLMLLT
jgi:hypothetical protein